MTGTRRRRLVAPALCALAGAAFATPAAAAGVVPAAAATTGSTANGTAPASIPVGGHMRLEARGLHASTRFALAGERMEFAGTVTPYVAGQTVTVNFYVAGRRMRTTRVRIEAGPGRRTGRFTISFAGDRTGRLQAVAVHSPSSQMKLFAAGSVPLQVISPNLSPGASGEAVRVLQRGLGALHYAVPQSGSYDEATADAVIAYRKMTGLPPVSTADASLFRALRSGAGAYRARFPQDGRHIEADLSRQVLVEVLPHGRVANIYPTSSGKPSTPTVTGHFTVYRKEPGVNSESMFDSNYFISGYAIHGYPEVPTYAASHGCLRVPNLDAPALFAWIRIGTIVDVYG
ncbi:MAG: L,D-transpeptidase family protein [Acidobacteriota bacterium]|nr:L,D-transpeptidase family protein [Acidobacteriota bacterium]